MQITISRGEVFGSEAELLVYPVLAGEQAVAAVGRDLPKELGERLRKAVKSQQFTGAVDTWVVLPVPPGHSAEWVLLVGVGERRGDVCEGVRRAAATAVNVARQHALRTVSFGLSTKEFQKAEVAEAAVEGAHMAAYQFTAYRTPKNPREVAEFELVVPDSKVVPMLRKAVERARGIMDGVTVARDLVNMSAHELTPSRLAVAAQEIAKASEQRITVKVLSRTDCQKLGMGAYLAVAQGSDEEPKFIHLTYTPPRPTREQVAIIGKGVTFDSGGLSLKPSTAMATMKYDMAGGATVLGVFAALAALKPKLTIHGLIAAAENMPSGKATHPGDVVRAMNGKTIEVTDTDAEGRLTLADALTYAQRKLGITEIVDLATLTGACVVALGEELGGLMTPDQQLRKALLAASKATGDRLWELPLEQSYVSQLQSDVADLRNLPPTRWGGALTAGLFLQQFIDEGTRWAHLDIAGPAFAERPYTPYLNRGGTGYGVRLVLHYLTNR